MRAGFFGLGNLIAKHVNKIHVGAARKTLGRIRELRKSPDLAMSDPEIKQHTRNVRHFVGPFVEQAKASRIKGSMFLNTTKLKYAAMLHDTAKLPWSRIADLPEKKLKQHKIKHVVEGTKRVRKHVSKRFANIVAAHHERINGRGYPLGLKGRKIPLEAQVLGIIDVYCALREGRSYRERHYKYSKDEAIDVLDKEADAGKFDKDLVYSFIEVLVNERGDYFRA